MNPQTIPDPSGRYGRYLHQWNRYTTIRGERAAAQSIIEQVHTRREVHRDRRNDLHAQGAASRWWPFTTRRQAQARESARGAEEAIETANRQIHGLEKFVHELTGQQEQAYQAAMDLRTQWEDEYAARERYEAGEEPQNFTERGLFAEFRKQDACGGRGPEGRRMMQETDQQRQRRRIEAAYEGLHSYAATGAAAGVDDYDDLTLGLIVDLLHASDEAGQDPQALLEQVAHHFEEEVEEVERERAES